MKISQIALGVMAAAGGFVDIGDLVFSTQSGAAFGYQLIWALLLGVVGIIIYSEMSGRVAAITKKPVFTLIRDQTHGKIAFSVLAASTIVNVLTCAAEIGGIAIVLKMLSGGSYLVLILVALLLLGLVVWYLSFDGIERIFGIVGLLLIVFLVAAIVHHPNYGQFVQGLVPHVDRSSPWTYFYFAIGIFAATLMPYEVYFYGSGAIEEKWKPSDLSLNRLTSIVGYVIGSLFVVGIIAISAKLFIPLGVSPQFLGDSVLQAVVPFGQAGLYIALFGMLFTISGAAIETCFAGAYNIAQYYEWGWGKHKKPESVPRFTALWMIIFAIATLIILTGIDPVKLTEYAVVFSVMVMPLTYLPILLTARDKTIMGKYVNGRLMSLFGWIYLVLIVLASVSAVPLMILTRQGAI